MKRFLILMTLFVTFSLLQAQESTVKDTLVLPERPEIGVGAVKCINTVNSSAKIRENENRLNSVWCKEGIGIKSLSSLPDRQVTDTTDIKISRRTKWKNRKQILIAHTNEEYLEAGVPVCYLSERGDTIVPYGKYRFCQTDTIRNIGFVYENKPNAEIVCIDVKGHKLFNVFKYDNGVDYAREGFFRITDDEGQMGFADTLGNVVIKPQFKFAFPFESGKAKVTFSGESKEVPCSDGEKHYWDSSVWLYIDRNGKIINE